MEEQFILANWTLLNFLRFKILEFFNKILRKTEELFILNKIARVILMVILFFLIVIPLLTEEQFTLE